MMGDDVRTQIENYKKNLKVAGDHLGTLVGVPIAPKKIKSDPKLQLFFDHCFW